MSHVGIRIVADWLAGASNGVNTLAALVPRFVGDPAPAVATVYDETRHGWVARNQVPGPETKAIATPAVIVQSLTSVFGAHLPQPLPEGGNFLEGELTIVVQLLQRDDDTEKAVTEAMYLLRAIRDSLVLLNAGANEAARTACGVRLRPPPEGVRIGRIESPLGDAVSSSAVLVSYPTFEATATP